MHADGPGATPSIDQLMALLMLGGAGLGLVAVGVTTAWGWTLFVPGLIALLVSLLGAWVILQSRDKPLRGSRRCRSLRGRNGAPAQRPASGAPPAREA